MEYSLKVYARIFFLSRLFDFWISYFYTEYLIKIFFSWVGFGNKLCDVSSGAAFEMPSWSRSWTGFARTLPPGATLSASRGKKYRAAKNIVWEHFVQKIELIYFVPVFFCGASKFLKISPGLRIL